MPKAQGPRDGPWGTCHLGGRPGLRDRPPRATLFRSGRRPKPGAVAQLGERLHGMQEVVGSIPIGSTGLRVLLSELGGFRLSAGQGYCLGTQSLLRVARHTSTMLSNVRHWTRKTIRASLTAR